MARKTFRDRLGDRKEKRRKQTRNLVKAMSGEASQGDDDEDEENEDEVTLPVPMGARKRKRRAKA